MSGISAAAQFLHGHKRGQRREAYLFGFDRAPLSAVSAASACERTALRFAKQQGAIATQSNGVERSRSGD